MRRFIGVLCLIGASLMIPLYYFLKAHAPAWLGGNTEDANGAILVPILVLAIVLLSTWHKLTETS